MDRGYGYSAGKRQFIGATGLIDTIADAVDFRGSQGPQGKQGQPGEPGPQGNPGAPGSTAVTDGRRNLRSSATAHAAS